MKKSFLILFFIPMLGMSQQSSTAGAIASTNMYTSALEKKPADANSVNALVKYTGRYKSDLIEGFEMRVYIQGGKLWGIKSGDSKKVELTFVSPSRFKGKDADVQVEFLEDAGEVQFMMVANDQMNWLVKVN
jgi:hypothetical protein